MYVCTYIDMHPPPDTRIVLPNDLGFRIDLDSKQIRGQKAPTKTKTTKLNMAEKHIVSLRKWSQTAFYSIQVL